MKLIKSILIQIDQVLRQNQSLINIILCGFLCLGIITQISSFASILQFRSDHRSIVKTVDNDSEAGIETAEHTNLINDNHRRSYGPVWYRVNYLMRLWADNPLLDNNRNDQQSKEKAIYFTLMLSSLISIYLLAAAIGFVFFEQRRYQLMSTLFLAPALLNEHFQSFLVIVAKPDHFLSLLVFISFVTTILLIQSNFEDKYLRWTAFFWGVTLSTKLTALPFIPVLLLIIYFSHRDNWFILSKKFSKYILWSYFLIGFPQNFDFWRNLAYIQDQNRQTSWADWHSFTEWIQIYSLQIVRPAGFLLLFLVIFPARHQIKTFFQKSLVLKVLMLFLIPFGFMLSRKIAEPFFRWYTFPFVSSGLVLVGGMVAYLMSKTENNFIGQWKSKLLNHPYSFLFLFFCLPWSLPLSTKTLSSVEKEFAGCRIEAQKTESYIEQAATNKEYILADPYAPFSASLEGNWVDSSWEMRPELIQVQKTKWIVLKQDYYRGYLTLEEGGAPGFTAHIKNIDQVRAFYRLFWRKDQTTDQHQQHWRKVYSDACGFEVWHQEN
jgi:hypothetical protein